MGEKTEKILKRIIEAVILKTYPFLKFKKIDLYHLSNNLEFDVYFITNKRLPPEIQEKIDVDVNNLFQSASLDTLEKKILKNQVFVWFKTPNAKDYSFHSTPNYKRRD